MEQYFFSATHTDENILRKSSSGGAFTAITDAFFELHEGRAVVYGAAMGNDLKVTHIRATDQSTRDLMRGSKYIPSDISGIYSSVKSDLESGMFVAFSGTPCQIAGLSSFLKVSGCSYMSNLLTIEVLCHGVGSEVFFSDYILHLEKKYRSKAISCNFRAKSRPGKLQDMEILFENGKKHNSPSTKYDWFYSVYNQKNYILRSSCYSCKFADIKRFADITVADSWSEFANAPTKSPSLIIANTESGLDAVKKAFEHMDVKELSADALKEISPASKPSDYEEFLNIYLKQGYLSAQRFIGNNTFIGRTKAFTADVLNRMNLIPTLKKIKQYIKR